MPPCRRAESSTTMWSGASEAASDGGRDHRGERTVRARAAARHTDDQAAGLAGTRCRPAAPPAAAVRRRGLPAAAALFRRGDAAGGVAAEPELRLLFDRPPGLLADDPRVG